MPDSEALLISFMPALIDLSALIAKLIVAHAGLRELPKVLDRRIRDILQGFFRKERLVRGDDNIWHGDQSRKHVVT